MIIPSKTYRTKMCNNSLEWAKKSIHDAPDGSLFLPDRLLAAQGRQGRVWQVAEGQLAITMLLKPEKLSTIPSEELPLYLNQLNMAITCGVLEPLKRYGVGLKWPNDFYVHNKKLGGIIFQLVWDHNEPLGVIVGFALNVSNTFDSKHELYDKAISLRDVMGGEVDKGLLQEAILQSCDQWYKAWRDEKTVHIFTTWQNAQLFIHKKITAHLKDGTSIQGITEYLLPNGDVVIFDDTNNKRITLSFFQIDQVEV